MNLLYVTSYDEAGQQFNGYMLHRAMVAMGHDSHMAVMKKCLNDARVHEIGGPFLRTLNNYLAKLEHNLSLHAILPILSTALYAKPYYKKADVVHLQLIQAWQFFSLFNLPIMGRHRKLVWTLHDPWLMGGHCVHPLECERWMSGCGQCPDLDLPFPIRHDRTALAYKLKSCVMAHSKLSLIVASKWMLERVRKHPFLSHLPCHLIPFGVDIDLFKPADRTKSKACFGIPPNAPVITFRSTGWRFKGREYIEKALRALEIETPAYLITFEETQGLDSLRDKFRFVELGWVTDREVLVNALRASDVFLMPSIAESFGMMAVESMACGTPVIAFEGTSLPDVIHAPEAGIAVPYRDHEALSHSLQQLLDDRDRLRVMSEQAVKVVRENYTLDLYVKRHLELYEGLLDRN